MLVIFDCDGVLVDSESLAADIFSDVLNDAGVEMSPSACFETFHGKTLAACYTWLEHNCQLSISAEFAQKINDETQRRFSLELQPVEGIFSVLDYLCEASIKFCVASNGGHKKIVNSLAATGILPYFPHRFSADDVVEGKPKPDVFLLAAKQMEEAVETTWVVEDSMSGYNAALAAGTNVLMYTPKNSQEFPQARSFNTMTDLIEMLAQQR